MLLGVKMRGRGSLVRAQPSQAYTKSFIALPRLQKAPMSSSSSRMCGAGKEDSSESKGKLTICARLSVAEPASSGFRSASVAVERKLTPAEHADRRWRVVLRE